MLFYVVIRTTAGSHMALALVMGGAQLADLYLLWLHLWVLIGENIHMHAIMNVII